MKRVFAIIGTIGFIALLFYSPGKQEDNVQQGRTSVTNMPYSSRGTLFNAIPSQSGSTNSGFAGTLAANTGQMPEFNPPHGEPWHRCEIPVGAPLNSAPQNTNADLNQSLARPVESAAPPATSVRPKLNPPHGQPWHRCDIDVGAPLDSPPRSTNNQEATSNVASTPEAITPVISTSSNEGQASQNVAANPTPENVGPKPALNPPHGQPWHRCDIKVGDPLP